MRRLKHFEFGQLAFLGNRVTYFYQASYIPAIQFLRPEKMVEHIGIEINKSVQNRSRWFQETAKTEPV